MKEAEANVKEAAAIKPEGAGGAKAKEAQAVKTGAKEAPVAEAGSAPKRAYSDKIGILHIYASRNNTMILLTDMTGAETIAKCSGGRVVKAQHKEGSPYAAMKVAEIVAEKARERSFGTVHIKVRGQGGIRPRSPGQGAEAAIRSLTRKGMRILSIENVTPMPHDGCRKKKRHRGKKQ